MNLKRTSELRKENHVLKGQLQKSHEVDQNSKGHIEDTILDLKKHEEEVKKIEEDITTQLQENIEFSKSKK